MRVSQVQLSLLFVTTALGTLVLVVVAQTTDDLYTSFGVKGVGNRGIWIECDETGESCTSLFLHNSGCRQYDDRIRTIQAFSLLSIFSLFLSFVLFLASAIVEHGPDAAVQRIGKITTTHATVENKITILFVSFVFVLIAWAIAAGTYHASALCSQAPVSLHQQGFKLGYSFALLLLAWLLILATIVFFIFVSTYPLGSDVWAEDPVVIATHPTLSPPPRQRRVDTFSSPQSDRELPFIS